MVKKLFVLLALMALPLESAAAPLDSFDAGSVHVDQYGSGSPALLLIPGLTDSGTVWGTTVARYSSTHAIYVLTLPGFGGSAPVGAPMLDRVDSDPFARRKAGVLPTVARWRPNGKSANGRRFAPLHHA